MWFEGDRTPGRRNPAAERGGRAGDGGDLRERDPAGAADLSYRPAREGVHRGRAGLCRYRRQRQRDQACVRCPPRRRRRRRSSAEGRGSIRARLLRRPQRQQRSAQPTAARTSTAKPGKPAAKTVNAANGKKPKIHREKIRFGQAPQNSLPAAPEETLTAGADQGAGAASVAEPAPGTAISSMSQQASAADDEDPLAPKAVEPRQDPL